MKSLIFWNRYHKGDCHFCRTFLKNIAKNNAGWKFYRSHTIERTLHDVPMEYTKKIIPGIDAVNIHIGQERGKYTKPHKPYFFGLCPKAYIAMFTDICKKFGLTCDTSDYTPVIDYSMFDIQKVDDFLSSIQKPCVIVSNGDVLSDQVYNFAMDPIIDRLKPFFTVVTTKDRGQKGEYFIGDIVKRDDEDLSELSYLSTKSYAFIGRCSGPWSFSIVKENHNGSLKMIYIAKDVGGIHWDDVVNNSYWIPSTDSMNIMLDKIIHILGV